MAVDEAGTTVKVSLPSGVPDRDMPNVYTLPLMEILEGVALDKVAVPPLMDKVKSVVSNAPLPPLVLYTASLNVASIVVLSDAIVVAVIVGTMKSYSHVLVPMKFKIFEEPSMLDSPNVTSPLGLLLVDSFVQELSLKS